MPILPARVYTPYVGYMRSIFCIALVCTVGLVSIQAPQAQAASHLADPLVVVVKDVTSTHCYQKMAWTLRALHASSTKRLSCPAGTALETVEVPLSEAKAHHEVYVVLPPKNASQLVWQQTNEQIRRLEVAEKHLLHQHPHIPACGQYGSLYSGSYVRGDFVSYEIDYQISYSCNTLVLDQAQMWGHAPVKDATLAWYGWLYAWGGMRWGPPDCIYLGTNHYTRSINWATSKGYYFVFSLTYSGCLGATTSVSLGPLV
jgi:hypothetical protein